MYIAGAITAAAPDSVTVQVTGTGPHATNLQGQTLVIAITPTTTILLNNQPAQATGPQTGQSVSGRIQKTAGATPPPS